MASKQPTRARRSAHQSSNGATRNGEAPDAPALRELLAALEAMEQGDFSVRLPARKQDPLPEIGRAFNRLVERNARMARELDRVRSVIGREGRMAERAKLSGADGSWSDQIASLNALIDDLVRPTTEVARVIEAVAEGDLSQKMALEIEGQPVKGEFQRIGTTVNAMVDQLGSFASEVSRVAREVGTEGKLGGQAQVKGVSGTWKDLTENVNFMAGNLTDQVRNIVQVTTAVANGDLSQKISADAKGEVLELKKTINTMVDQLSSFADEVTRVAREVGTEGRLGGQAEVEGVSGTWRDLTDNVNFMADNLTNQVRTIAQVTTAVANGDLSQKITVDAKGEVAALAETINTMVDQLSSFADEVTRVAREVGTEGKLGGQAEVQGVSGTWRDLTDNVNFMADNLTNQVRNIAQVTTAVANGDLSQKITVDAKGEVAALAETINSMTDTLRVFAEQVTGVAREVGTEGKLGGQAEVQGVAGTWKDLTDNVNLMADNLTNQVRSIAQVTTAVANGDLSQKVSVDARGEVATLADTINTMVDQLSSFADEVTRVAREVGTEGKLGGQAEVQGVAGTWKDLTDNVNLMADNLTDRVRNIAQVTTAVANGDLSQKITADAKGEILELKKTINRMVDQLSSFADEVTRVAREVGTEGKLGGQAEVKGVSGTWKDLTDNVNFMADNLTDQVRNIAQVTTAVANGDLSQKITADAKGEILELKKTINTMVDQLGSFATEVTRVAKEVGTEGKLGGQAEVEGVSGTWRALTNNVNQLAGNLTTQVRAIAEVSTAVTQGDLTRSITVDTQGEVAELKDNLNQMIANLRDTTQKNAEEDWLKTNLARISGLMQGQRDKQAVSQLIMSELTPSVSASHGAFYLNEAKDGEEPSLALLASYGFTERKRLSNRFHLGEGLVGQAALEKKPILLTEAPTDYIKVGSGLGEASPVNIIVLPILFEDEVLAVIELGTFRPFSEVHRTYLDQLRETIGVVLNTIMATTRTEELLEQSQLLTSELQSQSEELRQTNDQLEEKAAQLAEQNRDIEIKNREIERASTGLEEKAEQLALSSSYKSEFLANVSHELRTPLNSLLILAKLMKDNPEGNLTERQVAFASTIHSSGNDLMALINDILDLSKIEAGKMDLHVSEVPLRRASDYVRRTFMPVAEEKGLALGVEAADDLPASFVTDEQRLQQILKNLISNALKFTTEGGVTLRIQRPTADTHLRSRTLRAAHDVLAFAVQDTGIGMAPGKRELIFEAFQQADGTTSRRYGGTGLGLSISRELATLLGGEIHVDSVEGQGSAFTLYLPVSDRPSALPAPAATEPRAQNGSASDASLRGRRVLVVDDDMRNIFAITSMLEAEGMEVGFAKNGREALEALQTNGTIELVLMDVMMPEMDGHETTRALREMPQFHTLPVISLTAKAMRDDREKSLAAGASDYIVKPVDTDRLLAMMRTWLGDRAA